MSTTVNYCTTKNGYVIDYRQKKKRGWEGS